MSLTLRDLHAQLLTYERDGLGRVFHHKVGTLPHAQGMVLYCPKCFAEHEGPIGTHQLALWFEHRGVPAFATPGPARWTITGTSLDDLSLAPSIAVQGGCEWHGFIKRGRIE